MSKPIRTNINGCSIILKRCDYIDQNILKVSKNIFKIMSIDEELMNILIVTIRDFYIKNTLLELNKPEFLFNNYIDSQIINLKIANKSNLKEFKKIYGKLLEFKKTKNINLFTLKEKIDNLNKIRGTILEIIIEKKASIENRIYDTGCSVEINNLLIVNADKKTVDFAGHDFTRYHFYECKISPDSFIQNDGLTQIGLLLKIKDQLKKETVNSEIFCVTAGFKKRIISGLKSELDNDTIEKIQIIDASELTKSII